MTLKTLKTSRKQTRDIKFNKQEIKPFGLCSQCKKRSDCKVTTQTNAVIIQCVYR